MPTIYIADDEKDIRDLLCSFLTEEGFSVLAFEDGEALYQAFLEREPDLVILDIMMPGRDGLSLCGAIRKKSSIPILLLTARDTDADYITGFTLGCDDYFTKPFSPVKLALRVKAMLRRVEMGQKKEEAAHWEFGDLLLRPRQKQACCRGEELRLTNTEFALLAYLMEHQDRAISREELLSAVWGYDNFVETRATDDIIKRLRKKLLSAGSSAGIETVWGFGFRLV